jgi:ferritin-like protein
MNAPILRYFEYLHLRPGPLQDVSKECHDLAVKLAAYLPQNAETSAGLRKLLEAKDCLVRAALDIEVS